MDSLDVFVFRWCSNVNSSVAMIKLIRSTDQTRYSEKEIGGKAKNLFVLKDAGLTVPPFVAISCGSSDALNQDIIEEIKVYFKDLPEDSSFAVRSSALDEGGLNFSFAGKILSCNRFI